MCVYIGIPELSVCIELLGAPEHEETQYLRALEGGCVCTGVGLGKGGYDRRIERVFLIYSFV